MRLFKEASGLHDDDICCRGWCHGVDTSCKGTSKLWSVLDFIMFSLSQTLTSTTGTFFEHFSLTGYYRNDVEVCYRHATSAYEHIWAPCFAFDAILAVLSLWSAVRHSRQHSMLPRLNKPQLVDTLIQGNVIYFLGCAFSCPYRIRFDDRM